MIFGRKEQAKGPRPYIELWISSIPVKCADNYEFIIQNEAMKRQDKLKCISCCGL